MRSSAGLKLVALSAAVIVVLAIRSFEHLAGAAAATIALTVLARPNWTAFWLQFRPILLICALSAGVNSVFLGWDGAVLISGRLLIVLTLAALFTLTTPVPDVIDSVEHGLRRLIGADRAERFGLMVALTVRSVPLLTDLVRDVQQARRARGAERSLRAFAVPVMIRALKSADDLGDALLARGFGDSARSDRQAARTLQP